MAQVDNPTIVPADKRRRARSVCQVVVILAVAVVLCRGLTQDGVAWPDGAVHAMDGVLIHDWIAAGPSAWTAPLSFAQKQYARLPALGIGLHYPPAFAVAEAGVFGLVGVSSVGAKLTTVLFGILAGIGMYRLLLRSARPTAACIGAAALLSMPLIVEWGRQAMLEVPTIAAMLWASLLLVRYLEKPTWGRLAACTAVAISMPLFKQPGVIMLPVVLLWMLVACIRRKMPVRHLLAAGAAVGLTVGPFFLAVLTKRGLVVELVSRDKPWHMWFAPDGWWWVLKTMAIGSGLVVTALAVLGLAVGAKRRGRVWWIATFWLAVGLAFCVFVQHREPRYLTVIVPPLALYVSLLAERVLAMIPRKRLRRALAAALLLAAVALGWARPVPSTLNFYPVVAAHAEEMDRDIVLFCGNAEPAFIFAIRQYFGRHAPVVLRSSKIFYSCASDPRFHYKQFVHTSEEAGEVLEFYSPSIVVVEEELSAVVDVEGEHLIREHLAASTNYEYVGSYPVSEFERRPRRVKVYRRTAPSAREVDELVLPVPIVNGKVRVKLSDL